MPAMAAADDVACSTKPAEFSSSAGIEAELVETRGPGDATEMAQRATTEGRQLVIACGGDGTLNEVVNGLADAVKRSSRTARRCFPAAPPMSLPKN